MEAGKTAPHDDVAPHGIASAGEVTAESGDAPQVSREREVAIVFGLRGEQLVVADDGECVALLHHGANEAKNSRDFGTTVDEVANEDRLSLTMFPWTVELVGIAAFVAELLQQADEEAVFAVNVADDFEAGESWRRNSWFHSKPIRSGLGSDNRLSDAKSFRICLSQQEPIVCSFESRECPFIGLFGLMPVFVLRVETAGCRHES